MKKKKSMAVFILVCMIVTLLPAIGSAAEFSAADSSLTVAEDMAKAATDEALIVKIVLKDSQKAVISDMKDLQVWAERVEGEASGFDKVSCKVEADGSVMASVTSDIMGKVTIKAAKATTLEDAVAGKGVVIGSADGIFTGTATMNIGQDSFDYNGKVIALDTAPFIQNQRTFVPIRALSEACGATVIYDPKMESITISLGADVIKMKLGVANLEKNGQALGIDAVPMVTAEGRAVLPFRAIAEALDFNVQAIENSDMSIKAVTFTNFK